MTEQIRAFVPEDLQSVERQRVLRTASAGTQVVTICQYSVPYSALFQFARSVFCVCLRLAATLCCIQCTILSVAKRLGLASLNRWGIIQEPISAMAEVFGLPDEGSFDAVINRFDELAQIAEFYNLQSAG